MGIQERRRQQIIVAAKRVFSEKGYSKSTMEDIAKEAELSPGTLYLYFKNKDELFASLSLRILHYMNIRLQHVTKEKDKTPDQKIDALKEALYDVYEFDPTVLINMFHLQSSETLKNLSPHLFFFNDTATPEIYTLSYTLSLHDALPISCSARGAPMNAVSSPGPEAQPMASRRSEEHTSELQSHSESSYAVLCMKKKKGNIVPAITLRHVLNQPVPAFNTENDFKVRYGDSLRIQEAFKQQVIVFFNDTATTEIYTLSYTLSLHDALPISVPGDRLRQLALAGQVVVGHVGHVQSSEEHTSELQSHSEISYAVFCLKIKKKKTKKETTQSTNTKTQQQ